MANPTVKPGIPKYSSLMAALWVSDQIDQGGPSKGAWDALTGTFYPAYNGAALTPLAIGASGINALESTAAVCGINLAAATDLTTGVFNELGAELTMVALVRRPATSAVRSLIIQNTQKFTPPARGGYQLYMTDAATATGNEYAGAGGATSVAKTVGYPANEWMLIVYKRGADGVPKLYRNDVSNHDTDTGGTWTRIAGTTNYERQAALFNFGSISNVQAVPLAIAAVLLFRDGDITISDIQGWGGTSSGGVLVDPAAVLNAVFDFTVADVVDPVITGPTGAAGAVSIAINVAEPSTAVGTWTADEAVTWSLSGTDAASFSIGASTGICVFNAPSNFDTPGDAGGNNVYDFVVTATDAALNTSTQTVAVTVTNINEAPTFIGPNIANLSGVAGAAISNQDLSLKFADQDAGDTGTYSKGGTWPVGPTLSAAGLLGGVLPAEGVYAGLTVIRTDAGSLTATSNTFSITATASIVNAAISVQPSNATVTTPTAAVFTLTATGTAPISYQWQRQPASGAGYVNVTDGTGGTTNSYTTPATAVGGGAANNGDTYRCLVSNAGGSVTSNVVTLTVSPPAAPSITLQPTPQTVTAPTAAAFTVTATGTGLTYQWQRNPGGVGAWGNVVGGANPTGATYTTGASSVTGGSVNSGDTFRCLVTNVGGTTISSAVAITVNPGADTTAPTFTGTLAASAVTSNSYNLSWPPATDNVAVTSYERSLDAGVTWLNVGLVTALSITGRAPGSTDQCRVRAVDAGGNTSTALSTAVTLSNTTLLTEPLENLAGSLHLNVTVRYSWFPGGRIGALTGITPIEGTGITNAVSGSLLVTGLNLGSGVLMTSAWDADPNLDTAHYQRLTVI